MAMLTLEVSSAPGGSAGRNKSASGGLGHFGAQERGSAGIQSGLHGWRRRQRGRTCNGGLSRARCYKRSRLWPGRLRAQYVADSAGAGYAASYDLRRSVQLGIGRHGLRRFRRRHEEFRLRWGLRCINRWRMKRQQVGCAQILLDLQFGRRLPNELPGVRRCLGARYDLLRCDLHFRARPPGGDGRIGWRHIRQLLAKVVPDQLAFMRGDGQLVE